MENEIKAILRGLPGVKVEQTGSLWSISIGGPLSGARKDGKALAIDLRKQWEHIRDRERYEAEPVPVAIPEFLKDPEPATDYEAIIAGLKAQLAERETAPAEAPKPQDDPLPVELADLFEVSDTPAESNEKLLVRLREVLGLIGLAEDAGGRAAPELYKRKDRLESGIRYNRGRMAEVI